MSIVKNIPVKEIFRIAEQVNILEGQVVSKTVAQNGAVSITIFAFDKDEEISTHEAKGDAFVTILEGTGKITIEDKEFILKEGESIVMPATKPHSVYGQERFKMLLVVIFPQNNVINPQ